MAQADGGAGAAGAGMQIAGNIFNEMVMEEAIKDKTEMMQKELEAANEIPVQQICEKKGYDK